MEEFRGQSRQVTVKTMGYTGWKLVGVVPARTGWPPLPSFPCSA